MGGRRARGTRQVLADCAPRAGGATLLDTPTSTATQVSAVPLYDAGVHHMLKSLQDRITRLWVCDACIYEMPGHDAGSIRRLQHCSYHCCRPQWTKLNANVTITQPKSRVKLVTALLQAAGVLCCFQLQMLPRPTPSYMGPLLGICYGPAWR